MNSSIRLSMLGFMLGAGALQADPIEKAIRESNQAHIVNFAFLCSAYDLKLAPALKQHYQEVARKMVRQREKECQRGVSWFRGLRKREMLELIHPVALTAIVGLSLGCLVQQIKKKYSELSRTENNTGILNAHRDILDLSLITTYAHQNQIVIPFESWAHHTGWQAVIIDGLRAFFACGFLVSSIRDVRSMLTWRKENSRDSAKLIQFFIDRLATADSRIITSLTRRKS